MKKEKRNQGIILAGVVAAGVCIGTLWGLRNTEEKTAADDVLSVENDELSAVETMENDELSAAETMENDEPSAAETMENDEMPAEEAAAFAGEEGTFQETEREWFMKAGRNQGAPEGRLNIFYNKLVEDDVWKNGTRKLHDLIIYDLDGNGQDDMLVMAGEDAGMSPGGISLYFNGEPAYVFEEEEFFYGFGFWNIPCVADVDNDGNTELILEVANGGNGGPGGRDVLYLRHTGKTWEVLDKPWNLDANYEDGFLVNITCVDVDRYEAFCSYLNESIAFDAENCWEPEEMRFGEMGGGNCRGFYGFQCIEYRGKNALQCLEYLHGEGGNAHGIGVANFIFVWDENGKCSVEDWWVETL